MAAPRTPMLDVMRILKYPKTAARRGLLYGDNSHLELKGYICVDWAGSIMGMRFTIRYCVYVGGNLIS